MASTCNDPSERTAVRPYARGSPGHWVRSSPGSKPAPTKRINTLRETPRAPVWQRNYYEHVLRSEDEMNRIRDYISHNPFRWAKDQYNRGNQK